MNGKEKRATGTPKRTSDPVCPEPTWTTTEFNNQLVTLLGSLGLFTCLETSGQYFMLDEVTTKFNLSPEEVSDIKASALDCGPFITLTETIMRAHAEVQCMLDTYTTTVESSTVAQAGTVICGPGKICGSVSQVNDATIEILEQNSVPPSGVEEISYYMSDSMIEAFERIGEELRDMGAPQDAQDYVLEVEKRLHDPETIRIFNDITTRIINTVLVNQRICLALNSGSCIDGDVRLQNKSLIRVVSQNIVTQQVGQVLGFPGMSEFFGTFDDPFYEETPQTRPYDETTRRLAQSTVALALVALGFSLVWCVTQAARDGSTQTTKASLAAALWFLPLLIIIGIFLWPWASGLEEGSGVKNPPASVASASMARSSASEKPLCCITNQGPHEQGEAEWTNPGDPFDTCCPPL